MKDYNGIEITEEFYDFFDTFHLRFLLCSLLPNGCLLFRVTSLSKALVM
jgi:hypothetical protein